jgi:two-component system chemotaxis response regulator CheY
MKSLVVEDEFTSRVLLQYVLSSYGECHIAVNGEEAVDAFHAALASGAPYNLISMDIRMPEMDGNEAIRRIRAIEAESHLLSTPAVKILLVTAVENPEDAEQLLHARSDARIGKPIEATKLLDELRKLALIP